MRTCIVRVAFAVLILPAGASAQSLSLTEAEALARLSPASPYVRALRAEVDVARADVAAASRWPNPRATVNRESSAGVTEYITTVTQPLPVTGRRGLDTAAAAARADAVSSRSDDQLRQARANLRLAFAALVEAQAREQQLAAAAGRLRELVDVLARREAAGDAAGFDRLRAEREALDVEAERASAAVARAHAQGDLAAFFENPGRALDVVAVPGETAGAPLPPLETLVARALSTRGELRALEQEAQGARLAERAAERRQWPEPEIVAGTKTSSAGDTGAVFAVHASIPLFDRFDPERAAARARADRAQAGAEVFRAALAAEIASLRAAVTERRAAADRYRASEATTAELERIAQVSYDAGERGILELLDAYRTGAAARVRQAGLDGAARQAEIELAFASGWEIE
jgi:cobalt-zinc-cadmium efflux system outer membrane protein